jgi:DNA-binding transcriptional regulator YdaS (Cro superfamily)
MTTTTLAKHIDRLVKVHGGLRAAAGAIGVQPSYLSRLRSGKQKSPSEDALSKLGLKRTVIYTAIQGAR